MQEEVLLALPYIHYFPGHLTAPGHLNLHNHDLIKCQNDSDSRKYILGNLDVLPDSLSRSLVIQTKGAMSRQVFNQLDMFCPGPWSCR